MAFKSMPSELPRGPLVPAQPPVLEVQEAGDGPAVPLLFYWSQLRRHLWLVAAIVTAVTLSATLYSLTLPKLYDAAAVLRIDSVAAPNVGSDSVQPSAAGDPQLLVSTAQQVLTTPAVVNAAIGALHLERNTEFAPRQAMDPGRTAEALERAVARNVLVTRPPGTLLLEVHFRSSDPEISAQVANGLAASFLEHEYRTRYQALTQSSEYMTEQLAQLKAKSEQSQEDLVNYESTANVLDPDDKTNVMQARLTQINADYTKAQTQRMQVESEYRLVQNGDTSALALVEGEAERLAPLRSALRDDSRELARLSSLYGPNHPLLRRQQQIVQYDQQALDAAVQQATTELSGQYAAALGQEQLLGAALRDQRTAMDAFNRRAITYRALQSRADNFSKLYYDLQQRIQEDNISAGFRSEGLRITSPALPNYTPVSPRVGLVAVLAFLFSSILAVGGVLAASNLDQSVSSAAQVEQMFRVPVLATLPAVGGRDGGLTGLRAAGLLVEGKTAQVEGRPPSRSSFHEAVLGLHSVLALAAEQAQVLGVTSALPGEGKSTVSANLAAAFALLGQRTVLVDCDMRKPNVHRQFGRSNRCGVSSLLRDRIPVDQALQEGGVPNLQIIAAGPATGTPTELLQRYLPALIDELRGRFDRVIVDCTPALGFADALAVANSLDALLIVVKAGDTSRQLLGACLRYFRDVRATLLGVVLNRVSHKMNSHYGYYQNYSRYYRAVDDAEEEEEL